MNRSLVVGAWLFGLFLVEVARAEAEAPLLVHGRVTNQEGIGLQSAALYLRGSAIATTTDEAGRFELRGRFAGPVTLVIRRAGYAATELSLTIEGRPIEVEVILLPLAFTETISVRAPVLEEFLPNSMQRSGLDALITPGTAGDLFRAVQMMPGLAKVDEGAGLFVRGGDVSETITFLDRARVAHPYRYETTTGGLFGTVPPWQVSGFSLASGGFPARYGNALSGVLELSGLEAPQRREAMVSVGLGAASASIAFPLGSSAGARVSSNQTYTRALFEANDLEQEFSRYPDSTDLSATVDFGTPEAGWFRAFAFREREEVGVATREGGFTGTLESGADNRLYSLGWERRLGGCCLASALVAGIAFAQSSNIGVVDLREEDTVEQARFEILALSDRWSFRFGTEWEIEQALLAGEVPIRGGDMGGIDGTKRWRQELTSRRGGGYLEVERELGPLRLDVGARADHHSLQESWTWDPRLALVWNAGAGQSFRLAWGIYHQAPDLPYLDITWGNPDLDVMRAEHWALGYQVRLAADALYLRVETYSKTYEDLPVEDGSEQFVSDGYGSARGLDLYGRLTAGRWSGWLSYSYLRARRRWTRWQERGKYAVPDEPVRPDFEIPHTVQLSMNVNLPASMAIGGSARWATGRPFTPVAGAQSTPEGIRPLYGPPQSERLPDYRRVDLNLSRSWPLPHGGLAVGYLGIINLLDRRNVFEYAYSEDYSEREPARSSFGRSFYFGMSFQMHAGQEVSP